jgi:magnesium-transporting ATPase (P-type)
MMIMILVIIMTQINIISINANNGNILWQRQHGPGTCYVMDDDDDGPCFTTSSPAVDPSLLYLSHFAVLHELTHMLNMTHNHFFFSIVIIIIYIIIIVIYIPIINQDMYTPMGLMASSTSMTYPLALRFVMLLQNCTCLCINTLSHTSAHTLSNT